jgi:hypothetical protein
MELDPEALKLVDDEGSALVGTEFAGRFAPNPQRQLPIVVLPDDNSRGSLAERANAILRERPESCNVDLVGPLVQIAVQSDLVAVFQQQVDLRRIFLNELAGNKVRGVRTDRAVYFSLGFDPDRRRFRSCGLSLKR